MTRLLTGVLVTVGLLTAIGARSQGQAPEHGSWSPRAAAAYLDGRAVWWATWKNSARDHGTFCVSCHTAMPYALARSSLRTALAERESTAAERTLFENVARRVTMWKDVAPFYSDQGSGLPKTSESRGTEAILNALILATRDAPGGRLAEDTRTALGNMWVLQMRTGPLNGAWAWLNFKYEPWESNDAPYMGAALAALAVGTAPDGYAASADIQEGLKRLRGYVQTRVRSSARAQSADGALGLGARERSPHAGAAPGDDRRRARGAAGRRRLEHRVARDLQTHRWHRDRHGERRLRHRAGHAGAAASGRVRRRARAQRAGVAEASSGSRDRSVDGRVVEQAARSGVRSRHGS